MPLLIVYLQALKLLMESCVCHPEPVGKHGSRLYRWQFMPNNVHFLGAVLAESTAILCHLSYAFCPVILLRSITVRYR